MANQGFQQPGPNQPRMQAMQGQGQPQNMQMPGMHMQGHGMQVQGPGMQVQGPGMPMQGPGMPMHGPGMPMQGPGMQMQGPGMQMQGSGMQMPGHQGVMQGQFNMQMQGIRQPQMQGPGISNIQGPRSPNVQMAGPQQQQMQMPGVSQANMQMPGVSQANMQMPGQQNMQMQGQQNVQMQGQQNMQMPGQQNVQMQGQQNMQMQGQQNVQMPGQQNIQMQGPGQMNIRNQQIPVSMQSGQMPNMRFPQPQGGPGMYNMMRPGAPTQMTMARPPPAYTPDMAKDFTQRQQILQREQMKLMEKQKKKMEQEFKQRQFQETQKRLKEFSSIGGRKMDVDAAIHSIMGTPEVKGHGPKSHGPPMVPQAPVEAPPPSVDDDFADFMSCPSPAVNQPSGDTSANQVPDNSGTANETIVNKAPSVQTKTEEKKDLMSMMMECSDLSAQKEAKSFKTKMAVKDVQPHHRVATYHQSQKAHQWGMETQQLSELFTLPEPEAPPPTTKPATTPQPSRPGVNAPQLGSSPPRHQRGLPPWLTGETPVPDVYRMVLEACSKDHKIDTAMLYPILLRSNLSKEVLGHLWKLCNKQTPGQLRTPELYMLLAMVSIAQNNMNINTLDILLQCPQAPVPFLGQEANQPTPASNPGPTTQPGSHPSPALNTGPGNQPSHSQASQAGPLPNQAIHQVAQPNPGNQPTPAAQTVGNQPNVMPQIGTLPSQAVHPGPVAANPNSEIFSQPIPTSVGRLPPPGVRSLPVIHAQPGIHRAPHPPVEQEEFADFQSASFHGAGSNAAVTNNDGDDDFGDFKSVPASTTSQLPHTHTTPATHPTPAALSVPPPLPRVGSDLIGEEDKYTAFRIALESSPTQKEPDSNALSSNAPLKSMSEETNFADFSSFKDNSSSSDFQSFSSTPSSANQDFTISSQDSLSPNHRSDTSYSSTNQSKDNKSGNESDDFGEFADFKQASTISVSSNNPAPDKLSAIKALVMDRKVYSEKPVEQKPFDTKADNILSRDPADGASALQTENPPDDDDWDPFVKSDSASTQPTMSWNQPTQSWNQPTQTAEKVSDGWADFRSAGKGGSDEEFGSFHSKPTQATPVPPTSRPDRLKVDPQKAYSMFKQNKQHEMTHSSSGTGMSALDTEPPELPDFPDEDDDQDLHVSGLDKFGTFQGQTAYDLEPTGGAGISSLVTPYGGFDDLEEEQRSANKKLPWNNSDSNKDLQANQKQSYNTSIPNSQSSSSLEFTGWSNKSKAVLEDSQSTKSLDLKPLQVESEEGSPTGGDSQSVSSLDFPVTESKKTTAPDQRSVGSLDLRAEPVGDTDSGVMEESFGDFSQAPNITEPVTTPRDVSEILNIPINMVDRYVGLIHDPEDSDRHIYCWEKCLSECESILRQANETFNGIDSLDVCREVIDSARGNQYIEGVMEIYRVASRIRLAMHGLTLSTDGLEDKQKEIHNQWNNLASFIANSSLMPTSQSLSFKTALIRSKEENIDDRLCGVCLLDADIYSDSTSANENAGHKLSYGGRNYHAPCANFWVNCINSTLPALKIPELL